MALATLWDVRRVFERSQVDALSLQMRQVVGGADHTLLTGESDWALSVALTSAHSGLVTRVSLGHTACQCRLCAERTCCRWGAAWLLHGVCPRFGKPKPVLFVEWVTHFGLN